MTKEKSTLSVWILSMPKRYYLKHPFTWLREVWINIQCAYERATKGYCYMDWANFDAWFKSIAPSMLRELAEYGHGYPGRPPFDDPEAWSVWLKKMADQIEASLDEYTDNEYTEEFLDDLDLISSVRDGETEERKELRQKFFKRWDEIREANNELFVKTMKELLEYWRDLWD